MNGAASNVAPFSLLKVRRGMGTCAIYIDGGYLDKVLQQDYQQTRVDIGQLVEQMRASDTCFARTTTTACLINLTRRPPTSKGAMHRKGASWTL